MKKRYLVIGLLVLATATIIACLLMRKDLRISKETAKALYTLPNSKYTYWNDAEIHYIEEGEGQAVFMIHGFGGSLRNFLPTIHDLKEDFRVIAVDLPGFALSDAPSNLPEEVSYVDLYQDFMTFCVAYFQLDSFYIMGNSLGGLMAWQMANSFPEKTKGLVLLASAGYEMDQVTKYASKWLIPSLASSIAVKGMPHKLSVWNAEKLFADPEKINPEEVVVNYSLWNKENNLEWMIDMLASGDEIDTNQIQEIQTPTLIIWGEEDQIVPVEHAYKFHRDVDQSTLIIYNQCGHVPQIELSDSVRDAFYAFVERNIQE